MLELLHIENAAVIERADIPFGPGLNVLTGSRWSVVPAEMKDYMLGRYGKAPGPFDENIRKKVIGDEEPLSANHSAQNYHAYNYFVGQNDLGKLRVSSAGQGLYRDLDIHWGIGDWLASNCDYKLTVASKGSNAASMSLYLNDMSTVYDSIEVGGLSGGRTWTIPAGTLLGGGNCFRLRNLAADLTWVNLDYIRLEPVIPAGFKNTDDGALLIVH